ncbi:hypothetical protein THAOC_27152, partial [Thalassiosira oceanica]
MFGRGLGTDGVTGDSTTLKVLVQRYHRKTLSPVITLVLVHTPSVTVGTPCLIFTVDSRRYHNTCGLYRFDGSASAKKEHTDERTMQHDEMIWQVINHQFCSYKSTMAKSKGANRDKKQFCKHPYSTTGLCNRSSCPLANSKYATVREENGRIHLYIKTVERAHSPKNLWEKIYLSRNYTKALAQLD